MRSRTAKRPGPLLHQQRLHSARHHRLSSTLQRWDSGIAYYEALQTAGAAPVIPAVLGADEAQEKRIGAEGGEVRWSFSEFPDAPSSLSPRAISITSPLSHDRVVIEVGDAQLTLSREEAARLFAMGRDFGGKPQA